MVGGLVAYFARGETTGDFKLAQVKNRIQANKLEAEQLQIEKK
jgi:hypothetical protein